MYRGVWAARRPELEVALGVRGDGRSWGVGGGRQTALGVQGGWSAGPGVGVGGSRGPQRCTQPSAHLIGRDTGRS